ncbi:MAG TPA: glycogen debranching protein GlgX [Candidatus Avipropionibacterium avicola]|uniref:Glycogen debranching protein GlgX n=1 Tax=Candidatus Avipropionibacterium avicola TaxID=2840701 RepID=A0A9D1H075_9ACTN|nr:glycogen debranching protein GlgX [Candidatus Avipropionibacterium avicola]
MPAPAQPNHLGAHLVDGGVRFELWAPRASRVEVSLVAEDHSQRNVDLTRGQDGVWSATVAGVEAEQRYGFRVHGEWDPDHGMRFNPAKLLMDPYARAVTAGVDYAGPIRDHPADDDFRPDPRDSSAAVPLSVVVAPTPPPTPIARRTPMADSVIYELHVKGFTQQHPAVPEHLRGTYAGLAYPAVIDWFRELGVTAIELLPIHQFVSEPFLIGRGLSNYWGYNTMGFFAPHAAYCSVGTLGSQVTEFKEMVTAFHEAGIEVLLDVVYNHTGEGNHEGPTLSFRGIDHAGYYRLTEDQRNDYDVTGTGNSVDSSQPGVAKLILDSLRYWVTEMGVDGFRFDLATTLLRDREHAVRTDQGFLPALNELPELAGVKLIAEPWDVGPYGYQVGAFGAPWSEWNDKFRGTVRDYWRSHVHGVRDLAESLAGSPQTFGERGASASVNFVTAHDGMTLRDLVSYDGKHNEANGEDNRDGSDDNRSWNCGVEGETDDPGVRALRQRQARNLMATLLLADGVAMITAGDEFGRTQQGNNNAYCQDSPISWVHWTTLDDWSALTALTKDLLRLRSEHPVLRGTDRSEFVWYAETGQPMVEAEWDDGARRLLGRLLRGEQTFLTWFHSGGEPIELTLPEADGVEQWQVVAHTGESDEIAETHQPGSAFTLPGRTVLVLQGV